MSVTNQLTRPSSPQLGMKRLKRIAASSAPHERVMERSNAAACRVRRHCNVKVATDKICQQERGFEIVCSMHRSSVWLMKRCFTEGRALDKVWATFSKYLFRPRRTSKCRFGDLRGGETSARFPANFTQSPDAKYQDRDALSFSLTVRPECRCRRGIRWRWCPNSWVVEPT